MSGVPVPAAGAPATVADAGTDQVAPLRPAVPPPVRTRSAPAGWPPARPATGTPPTRPAPSADPPSTGASHAPAAGDPADPAVGGPAGDPIATQPVDVDLDAVLGDLRRHVCQLVAELGGPVRRIRLRSGATELEVQWHDPAPPEAVPPPPVVAAPSSVGPVVGSPADLPPGPRRPEPPTRMAVRSPMVGTFYRAPEPGAAPFVAVGDVVRPGQVVGIVEAMKLMNEVTADRAGRVAEVLAADGQPVEYDQPLVALDPA